LRGTGALVPGLLIGGKLAQRGNARSEVGDLLDGASHGALGRQETEPDGPVFRDYLRPAKCWSTVTPMIIDRNNGSEDRIRRRIVAMLGFQGYPEPTRVGFRRAFWGMEHLPIKVRVGSRLFVHVEVEFPVKVAGPVFAERAAGYGIGLFARK
jgi:hypothetical protein